MQREPFFDPEYADRVRRRVAQLLREHGRSVLSLIGTSPMVELSVINRYAPVRVYAKVEALNPSGSVKDRIVLYLVADAMERGLLKPGVKVVEASSGNTGIALAMLGARLGLEVLITMPDNVTRERERLIRAYGAQVMLTPGRQGTTGAIERARDLGNQPGYVWLAQHYNLANSLAHYETTGAEIVSQIRKLEHVRLDAFVGASGTTGTLMGISVRLKQAFPDVRVVSVWPRDQIMGIRRPEGPSRPGIYDPGLVDEIIEVVNADAVEMTRVLARREGILTGPSGGAVALSAFQVAERLRREQLGGAVVALLPDSGERYLSTI